MSNYQNPQTLLQIGIISLFPDIFNALKFGVTGRAITKKIIHLSFWDPKNYLENSHSRVDDRPYGGGPGMVMRYLPLSKTIQAAKDTLGQETPVINLSPQGQILCQTSLRKLSTQSKLIILSGRYEGIDERLLTKFVDAEYSIGDFILSGGEIPSLVLIDALTRLLPGVLGNPESTVNDSLNNGLLQYPQYTRPEKIEGQNVPEILLTGDHRAIENWRKKQSLGRTWIKRPDLLNKINLTAEDKKLLKEFIDCLVNND